MTSTDVGQKAANERFQSLYTTKMWNRRILWFFFCIDKKPYCLFALHSHYIFFKMLVYNYFLISIFFSIIHMLVAKKNLKVKSMTSKHNDDLGQMKDSNLYTRSI